MSSSGSSNAHDNESRAARPGSSPSASPGPAAGAAAAGLRRGRSAIDVTSAPEAVFLQSFHVDNSGDGDGGGGGKRARRPPSKYVGGVSLEGKPDKMHQSIENAKRTSKPMANLKPLPLAPTYYPTVEEFEDPCAFISKIAPDAAKYGICKIVPPSGWSLPDTLPGRMQDSRTRYETSIQNISRISEGLPMPDGKTYTAAEYKVMADKFKQDQLPLLSERPQASNGGGVEESPTAAGSSTAAAAASSSAATAASPEGRGHGTQSYEQTSTRIMSTADAIERAYWRVFEAGRGGSASGGKEVTVEYAKDQDTRKVGSGFPRMPLPVDGPEHQAQMAPAAAGGVGAHAGNRSDGLSYAQAAYTDCALTARVDCAFKTAEYYRRCGWNLNNLPFLPPSVLRHIHEEINGVNVPWLYMGMLYASFAWHNEDHYLYSVNYMHAGEGKTWYGVPGRYAPEFEKAMTSFVKDGSAEMMSGMGAGAGSAAGGAGGSKPAPESLLYAINTMVSPAQLIDAPTGRVPVYRLVQCPNDFIITFPRAYHSGFSHGWNMAEACNFALADWLPFGRQAVERYRQVNSSRNACFSHEQLICNLARHCDDHPPHECWFIYSELKKVIDEEERGRAALYKDGVNVHVHLTNEADPRYECVRCKCICYISSVLCRCPPTYSQRMLSCLRHARSLCKCGTASKLLCYWYKIPDLRLLEGTVKARAMQAAAQPLVAAEAAAAVDGDGGAAIDIEVEHHRAEGDGQAADAVPPEDV